MAYRFMVAMGVAIALTGCAPDNDDAAQQGDGTPQQTDDADPEGGDVVRHDHEPALLTRYPEGEEARVSGYLRHIPDADCLVFEHDNGERHDVAVWPDGTEPVGDNGLEGVNVPGFGTVELDQRIQGGGGYHTPGQDEQRDEQFPAGTLDCVAGEHGSVVLINQVSEASED